MSDPTWDETIPIATLNEPKWEETQPVAPPASPPAPSIAQTAARQVASGGSFGFADEANGALNAAGRIAGVEGLGTARHLENGGQELSWKGPTFKMDDIHKAYQAGRDSARADQAADLATNPKTALASNIAGGVLSAGGLGKAATTLKGMAGTGALAGLGNSNADLTEGDVGGAALDTAKGAGIGLALGAGGKLVGKGIQSVRSANLAQTAEGLAESATGATGKQAENFLPGTGRYMLDNKIVGFGDSPGDIASRANAAMDTAEAVKQNVIQNQPSNVPVDRNTVYNYLRDKIQSLSNDESQTGLAKALEGNLDDITATADANGSEIPLSQSETVRKGFDKIGKWNSSSDAVANEANKITANAYREAGENAATQASPEMGQAFQGAKAVQHRLIPVAEAAEKRASTLSQSPIGGLGDIASMAVGGPKAAIARRLLSPRIASAGAVTADQLSKVLEKAPESFGQFAGVLQGAAARGGVSLGATDYILQQTNADYRSKKNEVFSNPDDSQGKP